MKGYKSVGGYVRDHVLPQGVSVTEAARRMGIGRPAFSNFLNGKASLSRQMAQRLSTTFGVDEELLLRMQEQLDAAQSSGGRNAIVAGVRRHVPPFRSHRALNFEQWADEFSASSELPVLVRRLVHSTGAGVEEIDFPAHEHSQRRGWDGRVRSQSPNPWVPEGLSVWELSVRKDSARKASKDYIKSTKVPDHKRLDATFVVLTPRRWDGKDEWAEERRQQGEWGDVRAYDSSDLEQWIEQSIPAQVWFTKHRTDAPGHPDDGVETLEDSARRWCAGCGAFSISVESWAQASDPDFKQMQSCLVGSSREVIRIESDSTPQSLAFLAGFVQSEEALKSHPGIQDRVAVFTKPGVLPELMRGSDGLLIPIAASPAVEQELAECELGNLAFVATHRRNRADRRAGKKVVLEQLPSDRVEKLLRNAGIDHNRSEQLALQSGGSLTVLRRMLASGLGTVSEWLSDPDLCAFMLPALLAGTWNSGNARDKELLEDLSKKLLGEDWSSGRVDNCFSRLVRLNDSPVWDDGSLRGVVSKADALYCRDQQRKVGPEPIQGFLDTLRKVLFDDSYRPGSQGGLSQRMVESLVNSLPLLADFAVRQCGSKVYDQHPAQEHIRAWTSEVLRGIRDENPTIPDASDLFPSLAEAAPDEFLDFAMAWAQGAGKKASDNSDRVGWGLVRGLEVLAWMPNCLPRVADTLAKLAANEVPSGWGVGAVPPALDSLIEILRFWLPQTAAPLNLRKAALDRVVERQPTIGWRVAFSMIRTYQQAALMTRARPQWRDWAHGAGWGVPRDEAKAFSDHCLDECIGWRNHTLETLAELLKESRGLDSAEQEALHREIEKWNGNASDEDRANFQVKIRLTCVLWEAEEENGPSFIQRVLDLVRPADAVWRNVWLFASSWVEVSPFPKDGSREDHETRSASLRILRDQAVQEVIEDGGSGALLRLAHAAHAPYFVGEAVARTVADDSTRLEFLATVAADGDWDEWGTRRLVLMGFLQEAGGEGSALVEQMSRGNSRSTTISLLCLCSCSESLWASLERLGSEAKSDYWQHVNPVEQVGVFLRDGTSLGHAVSCLLSAGRPRAAFIAVSESSGWKDIPSDQIRRVLECVHDSTEAPVQHPARAVMDWRGRVGSTGILDAFDVLNRRGAFSQKELAELEALHLSSADMGEKFPKHIASVVSNHPEVLARLFERGFPKQFAAHRGVEGDEEGEDVASVRMYLWMRLACIPGRDRELDEKGKADYLRNWTDEVRRLCGPPAPPPVIDDVLGQILARGAPSDEDGLWPCRFVANALDRILEANVDFRRGFEIGKENNNGFREIGFARDEDNAMALNFADCASTHELEGRFGVAQALRNIARSKGHSSAVWHQDVVEQKRS